MHHGFFDRPTPPDSIACKGAFFHPHGHGSKARTPSEHPNPHENRLKWVVHLPQNGNIGFDPQPNPYTGSRASLALAWDRSSWSRSGLTSCSRARRQARARSWPREKSSAGVRSWKKGCPVNKKDKTHRKTWTHGHCSKPMVPFGIGAPPFLIYFGGLVGSLGVWGMAT